MKCWKSFLCFLSLVMITLFPGPNDADEAFAGPSEPEMNAALGSESETKINEVLALLPFEAFQRLQGIDFIVDEKLLKRAIFERFGKDRKEAIDLVLNLLGYPVLWGANGEILDMSRSFYVARKIVQVFPESWPTLRDRFDSASPMVRGDIILLSGRVAAGPHVTNLLFDALDDKDFYGEKSEWMEGDPMRICDLAYNQLVLRFMIPSVLRSIGTVHAVADRDISIEKLKSLLKSSLHGNDR